MKKIFLYIIVSCCLLSNGYALTPAQEYDFSLEQYRIQLSYTRKQELIDHAQNRLVAAIHKLDRANIDYSEKKFHYDLALKKIKVDQHNNLLSRNADLLDLQKRVLIADHLDPEIQPQYIQAKQIYVSSKKQLRFHRVKLNLFAVDGKRTQIQQSTPMTPQVTDSINPPSTIKIGYRGGRGVGYKHSYSSAFLFLTPSWDRQFQPFFDLRTHVFNDGRFASNFGGGLRFISDNEDCVLGINAYHDFRSSHDLHTHQMGLGLEGLFPYFDVRVNGYLPVAKYTKIEPIVFHRFTGNIIEVTRLVRRAYPTVNAEFGVPIPGNFCRKASLYLGVGPYYLFGDKIQEANFKHSYGVKGRVSAKFFDIIGLEFVISHDHVYHRRVQGAVSLQLPLGRKKMGRRSCSAKEAMIARAKAPPERNEIIPIKKKQEFFPHTDANGNVLSLTYVNNTAGCPGSGTFENPF